MRSPEKVVAFHIAMGISVGVTEYNRTGIYSREREGPLGVWRSTIIGAEAACSGWVLLPRGTELAPISVILSEACKRKRAYQSRVETIGHHIDRIIRGETAEC